MSKTPEVSSRRAASLAARVIRRKGACTQLEALTLAGSVLTQAPNKPKQRPVAKRPRG